MIYQLSSPLQADLERATVTPPAGTQEQPLQWDLLSARGRSLHGNMEAGPKMLWREGSGCSFGVGHAARPLSSSLLRGGAMLLQQSETESRVTLRRLGW